jgi:hypothetical protein
VEGSPSEIPLPVAITFLITHQKAIAIGLLVNVPAPIIRAVALSGAPEEVRAFGVVALSAASVVSARVETICIPLIVCTPAMDIVIVAGVVNRGRVFIAAISIPVAMPIAISIPVSIFVFVPIFVFVSILVFVSIFVFIAIFVSMTIPIAIFVAIPVAIFVTVSMAIAIAVFIAVLVTVPVTIATPIVVTSFAFGIALNRPIAPIIASVTIAVPADSSATRATFVATAAGAVIPSIAASAVVVTAITGVVVTAATGVIVTAVVTAGARGRLATAWSFAGSARRWGT